MKFRFWKSAVITAVIMALTVWVYILADTYLYAVAEILNGVLVVAGFLAISVIVFLIVYSEPGRREQMPPREQEYRRAQR